MRRGFTLVEMLVATALVMLMMLLFAEVFGAAVGTITTQRGLANNDQKARSLVSILRHDLDNRTYRQSSSRGATRQLVPLTLPGLIESPRGIVPLSPGDVVDASSQRGFVYISENDTDDDTDDVIQFTAIVPPTGADNGPAPFYGRARSIAGNDINQPDRDDGVFADDATASRAAEITYFMRGGNLYRRVLLIRQPLSSNPALSTQPTQGPRGGGGPFTAIFEQPYALSGQSFYSDWDVSGTRVYVRDTNGDGLVTPETAPSPDQYRFHFHGLESLDNSVSLYNNPLGIPWNRFGFYSRFGISRPVEYLLDGANNQIAYVGRFTHEETSSNGFTWPGVEGGPGVNMLDRTDLVMSPQGIVALDNNANGAYDVGTDPLFQGLRTGEDILLTHVEAFDIKVWDPAYTEDLNGNGVVDPGEDVNGNGVLDFAGWFDLGHPFTGLYRIGARTNNYGPRPFNVAPPAINRVYDTWHPEVPAADFDGDGSVTASERFPPFRPLQVTTLGVPLTRSAPFPVTEDQNGNGVLDVGEDRNASGTLDFGVFYYPDLDEDQNNNGTVDYEDTNMNGVLDPGEDVYQNGVLDTEDLNRSTPPPATSPVDRGSGSNSLGYCVIRAGTSGVKAPTWPRVPGATVQDGSVIWQCFDNRIGLDRILITVRYRDVTTGQPRQVSLIHSLAD